MFGENLTHVADKRMSCDCQGRVGLGVAAAGGMNEPGVWG